MLHTICLCGIIEQNYRRTIALLLIRFVKCEYARILYKKDIMDEINTGSIAQIIGGSFIALLTLGLGMQKMFKNWKETNAESSVITLMHEELSRMFAQNTILASELNKLQIEVLNLNKELQNLTLENQRLQQEIVCLTVEISMLQKRLGSEVT